MYLWLVSTLLQNRKNLANRSHSLSIDRKAVGTPILNTNRNRNSSTSATSAMHSGKYTSSTSPQISFNNDSPSPVLGNRELSNRKLDRSMSEPGDRNSNTQRSNINSSRYKTELCRPFEESGHCKYGDKCQFAHGAHELRTLARHPKSNTELCRTFHTIGFCPYGPRCHFIHNEDERKLNQINQLKHQQQQHQQTTQSQQQHTQQAPMNSHPTSGVQRPKSINFNLTLPLNTTRDQLGSTADSPPSSVTDSPTMSPTFMGEDFPLSAFSPPPASAPPSLYNTAFPFQELPTPVSLSNQPMLSPLNVQTDSYVNHHNATNAAPINNQRNNNETVFADTFIEVFCGTPPSPPDSLCGEQPMNTCGSPLDISRGLRLPIFSRLSIED